MLRMLSIELSHRAFIRLVRRIVALATWLSVCEVAAHFLQSLGILHLFVAHRRLRRWVHAVEVKDFFIGSRESSNDVVVQVARVVALNVIVILQLELVLVGGLRAASDLLLSCRCSAHGVRGTVHLQVVCILQYLSLVAQLLALLILAVANYDHSLVACVCRVGVDVRLSSAVLWTSIFVYHLALVLVLAVSVLRLRRNCDVG